MVVHCRGALACLPVQWLVNRSHFRGLAVLQHPHSLPSPRACLPAGKIKLCYPATHWVAPQINLHWLQRWCMRVAGEPTFANAIADSICNILLLDKVRMGGWRCA